MSLAGPTTTLTVVQGATGFWTLQGKNQDGSIPTQFLSSDVLTSTVWLAQGEPAIVNPTATWFLATSCQFSVAVSMAQTAGLAIDTTYNLQVFVTRGGVTYCVGWTELQILPAAGSQPLASPPDLVTGAFASSLLVGLSLNEAQLESLPTLITSASNAIRSYCNRLFYRQTYTEIVPVALNGEIRLSETPINQIYRGQSMPEVALSIMNTTATSAWVSSQTTGGLYILGSGLSNLAVTGLILNWQANGVTSNQPIAYTTNMTIGALATAISAAGNGWSAYDDVGFQEWPVTELFDTYAGKGASSQDLPDGGANYHVFSSNITDIRPDPDAGERTGIWYVGRVYDDPSMKWGPDAPMWGGMNNPTTGRVKVSYDGGPPVVPMELQNITVELVKMILSRYKTDLLMQTESAGDYSYTVSQDMIKAFPRHVIETLARYREHFA